MFYQIPAFHIHDKHMSYVMVNVYHRYLIMHMNNLIEINMKMLMMVDYEQEKTIERENPIELIEVILRVILIDEDKCNVLYLIMMMEVRELYRLMIRIIDLIHLMLNKNLCHCQIDEINELNNQLLMEIIHRLNLNQ